MSLVAYESSDDSDNYSDSETAANEVVSNQANVTDAKIVIEKPTDESAPSSIFSLPPPIPSATLLNNDRPPKRMHLSLPPPKTKVNNGLEITNAEVETPLPEGIDSVGEFNTNNLFLSLPAPIQKHSLDIIEEELDDVPVIKSQFETNTSSILPQKKPSKQVKITIPALSEFEDDEDQPLTKKIKPSSTPSGLLNMLPAPRNVSLKEAGRKLIPQVLTKKPDTKPKIPTHPKPAKSVLTATTTTNSSRKLIAYGSDEEADEDGSGNDYFSLDKEDKQSHLISSSKISLTAPMKQEIQTNTASYLDSSQQFAQLQSSHSYVQSNDSPLSFNSSWTRERSQERPSTYPSSYQSIDSTASVQYVDTSVSNKHKNILDIDDEALQRLQGKRKKKEEINIIDVQGDVYDVSSSFNKALTEEVVHQSSRKKGEMPTRQQKSKHQITYLAFQARERELLLKNQWSQNKMTKRQTQSKYGF